MSNEVESTGKPVREHIAGIARATGLAFADSCSSHYSRVADNAMVAEGGSCEEGNEGRGTEVALGKAVTMACSDSHAVFEKGEAVCYHADAWPADGGSSCRLAGAIAAWLILIHCRDRGLKGRYCSRFKHPSRHRV